MLKFEKNSVAKRLKYFTHLQMFIWRYYKGQLNDTVPAMEVCRGVELLTPLVLYLGMSSRLVVSYTLLPL